MVEFAVIATVLFLLLFGFISLALIEIGNSAGSNAAREGARVGIINFDCADYHGRRMPARHRRRPTTTA